MTREHMTPIRDPRYAPAGDTTALEDVGVGDRAWLGEQRQGWTVRARDQRYIILTKPFNLRHTVLYTVADLELGIRGTDNYGGLGYEDEQQIACAMEMFSSGQAEISTRNNVKLVVRLTKRRPDPQCCASDLSDGRRKRVRPGN